MAHYIDELNYVLTFEELYAMLCAAGVPSGIDAAGEEAATRYGKGFALSGGVTAAVNRVLEEQSKPAATGAKKPFDLNSILG